MIGPDGRPVTAATDDKGYYEFNGVAPTTDDGKAIQTKKDIKAMAEYALTDNLTVSAVSDEKALYYPDMLTGSGLQSDARNVVFSPIKMNVERGDVPDSTAPATAEPSSISVTLLVMALAIGLACLGSLYWFLNGKGQ